MLASQGKNLYLERIISWGVADLDDCTSAPKHTALRAPRFAFTPKP